LKPTFRAGGLTSGMNLEMGLNIWRNLPAMVFLRLFVHVCCWMVN
jgi:hypothetical protein